MLCKVCKDGLEGMWSPGRSKRLALLKDFLTNYHDGDNDDVPGLQSASKYKTVLLPLRFRGSMVTKYFNESIGAGDDLTRHGALEYVYGHHKDRASFLASKREGCAMCNRFRCPTGDENPKLQNLGYYSVFHVTLDQERRVDEPVMFVNVGNSSGGFEFVPFGKTHLAIKPR